MTSCMHVMHNSQLQMFSMLLRQSPEVLMALGISPATIYNEISKQENIAKLKKTSPEEKQAEDKLAWMSWLGLYRSRLLQELPSDCEDSKKIEEIKHKRLKIMQENNPRMVLRNYIAQKAIEMAEKGDYSEVNKVLKLLEHPYDPVLKHTEREEFNTEKSEESAPANLEGKPNSANLEQHFSSYFSKPPEWSLSLCVT